MANSFPLNNGTVLIVAEAPGGIYNAAQLKVISALCEGDLAVVKATEDQRMSLFVKEEDMEKVTSELASVGLGVRPYQAGLHQPTACLGELCPHHEQDALGAAVAMSEAFAKFDLTTAVKVGINGCAQCCVPCHTLDVSILGEANGYRISIGGKNSQIPEMASFVAEGVPAEKLTTLMTKVIAVYQESAEGDETLQDVIDRCGAGDFIAALSPYSQDAATGGSHDDLFGGATQAAAPAGDEEMAEEVLKIDDLADADDLDAAEPADEEFNEAEIRAHQEIDDNLPDDLTVGAKDSSMDEDINLMTDDESMDLSGDVLINDDSNELVEDPVPAKAPAAPTTAPAKPAAPAPQMLANSDLMDEAPLEEFSEEAEQQLESQLEESIEEEESLRAEMEPDENSEERLAALTMVETKSGDLNDTQADLGALADDTDITDLHEEAKPMTKPKGKPMPVGAEFQFSGVTVSATGSLMLQFASGAFVQVDPAKFHGNHKELSFGNLVIAITVADGGFHVEVDGMEFFLPSQQNAA